MEEQILCGERPLLADEVTFVYGVHRQEERLQFTMQNDVATDEVFGMEPGRDDDVTMFACYDLKRGEVCGTLDVKVFEDDGSKTRFLYSLDAEERALLRKKMDTYSIEKTGMSLHRHGEVYRLEQEGDIPPPDSVRHDAVTMLKRQEALSGDVGEHSNRKFAVTDIAHPDFPELHRIRALRDIGTEVRAGDPGGYVEREENLSCKENDDAWIYDNAIVCNEAVVGSGSQVRNRAIVRGHAAVENASLLCGNAIVEDSARVSGVLMRDHAAASGSAQIFPSEKTKLTPTLQGSCRVYGTVAGFVTVSGGSVQADEEIRNDSSKLKRVNGRQPGRDSRGGKGRKTRRREQNR